MDLNSDGYTDVLSGSYSRNEGEMAGLFQVLYGKEDGSFKGAAPLSFDGDDPIVIDGDVEDHMTISMPYAICTRPFAADLDDDGNLDLVVGNFAGTFSLLEGLEGGEFSRDPLWLKDTSGTPLRVGHHSDPVLVDWDADGDLDLISGSDEGAVSLFYNVGTKSEPSFAKAITLLKAPSGDRYSNDLVLGDEHITRPQHSTRVAVTDFNGDGKLDLLVGDSYELRFAAEGVSEDDLARLSAEWEAKMDALDKEMPNVEWPEDPEAELSPEDEALLDAYFKKVSKLESEREAFLIEKSTGSVWLMLQE